MKTGLVSQNEALFKGYPDIAVFKEHLFVIHNQALGHASYGKTKIIISASKMTLKEMTLKEEGDEEDVEINPEMKRYGNFDFKEIETLFKGDNSFPLL